MQQIVIPSKEEAADAAKRLRLQRRAFLLEQKSPNSRSWLDERKKEHSSSN